MEETARLTEMRLKSASIAGWAILIALFCFSSNSFMWAYVHSSIVKLEERMHVLDLKLQSLQKNTTTISTIKERQLLSKSSYRQSPAPEPQSNDSIPLTTTPRPIETVPEPTTRRKVPMLPPGYYWPNSSTPRKLHPCVSVIPKKIVPINCTDLPGIHDKDFYPNVSYMVVNLPRTGSSYLQEAMHSHPDVMVR